MAELQVVEAVERTEDFGSSGSRRLVRSGRIPGVVYKKDYHKNISFDAHAFSFVLRKATEGSKVIVRLGGEDHICVIKEIQEDLVRSLILHVDFHEVQ